ncbi:hypothetical protein [Achromobacter marplatensis]|uniref:hypothetical protein n=1 Tax=Achromobacter marplatensis TaxID=470868 RepID=UPI0028E83C64|nr:hypothetical protein [Achromobacter marplatensis]
MALNSSIPLQVQAPQIQNYTNALYDAARLRGAQQDVADQQRISAERNALADVLRQGQVFDAQGQLTPGGLGQVAQAAPSQVPAYAQLANQQTRLNQQDQRQGVQLAMQRQDWARQGIAGSQTPDQARQYVQSGLQSGVLDQQTAQQILSQIPTDPTAYGQWRTAMARQMMTPAQLADLERGTYSAPVQTDQGFAQIDRSGNVRIPTGPNGQPLMPITLDAEGQARVKRATSEAQERGKGAGELANSQQKKVVDAGSAIDLLDAAEALLPASTGSAAGRMIDDLAGAAGVATEGAKAIAALQTVAGQLVSRMPRMEGPQSDKDVQLYKQMAGDLANPSIPVETRQAALAQIRRLNEKYAPAGRQGSQDAAGAVQRQIARRGRLPDGRQVVEYTDGTREVLQ